MSYFIEGESETLGYMKKYFLLNFLVSAFQFNCIPARS